MAKKPNPKDKTFKVGKAALVGRPNVGKSTLLNAIIGQKVAITSPKPQTTRSQIMAYHEDDDGQIFFLDTPGFYTSQKGTAKYNSIIKESMKESDLIVYIVDQSRKWGQEDSRVWNKITQLQKPTILVINKIDIPDPNYSDIYRMYCEDDVAEIIEISAINHSHLETLRAAIFRHLPIGDRDPSVDLFVTPLISQSSNEYIAELIREKIYMHTGQEVPYQTRVAVDTIDENEEKNSLRIKGKIFVNSMRYKPMLIGANGQKIRQISKKVEKEIGYMTNKTVFVRLKVEVEK